MRLAYGINRAADQQGREHARSFVEEKMSSGAGGTCEKERAGMAGARAASAAECQRPAEAPGGRRQPVRQA